MKVLVTSAYADSKPARSFLDYARHDRFGLHAITLDPDEADVILFIEHPPRLSDWFYTRLRTHPLVVRYREKCLMYNEMDEPWECLPGLYTCLPRRRFDPSRHRACAYLIAPNPEIGRRDPDYTEPDLLFSFMGARTHPVRDRILALESPRSLTVDTTRVFHRLNSRSPIALNRYVESIANSKFVLCPRGIGTGSFRLFETMQMGRVPIILADDWAAPNGPVWDTFSIRVAERDVDQLPQILNEREGDWQTLATNARTAWEEWFAPGVTFHRMVEWCAEILEDRRRPESISQRLPNPHYIGRRVRHAIRPPLREARAIRAWLSGIRSQR